MSDANSHSTLIGALSGDLKPVRRLRPPVARALIWVACFLGWAVLLYISPRFAPMGPGPKPGIFAADAFVYIGMAASALTAILGGIAAFQLSVPDRSSAWALLPLPALVVWQLANGLGCLATIAAPNVWGTSAQSMECFVRIIGFSIPLAVILVLMLRRASPLRPNLVAMIGGVAVAGAASTLLIFVHPHDTAVLDLAAHTLAVALVVGLNVALGGRLLTPRATVLPIQASSSGA